MTGDRSKFIEFTPKEDGFVTYGDNNRGKILGSGIVGNPITTTINNVLYVKVLRHNLLSISQLCDKGYKIVFDSLSCIIENIKTKKVEFKGHRVDNIYMLDLDGVGSSGSKSLATKSEDYWL